MAKKMMKSKTLMKVLSLLVVLAVLMNLGPVNTLAARWPNWGNDDDDKTPTSGSVDHVDIGVKLTADIMIDGVLYEDLSYTMESSDINSDSLVISSTGGHSYSLSSYSRSTGSSGISQFRISGNFPVGTIDAPVYYTVKLTKTVTVRTNDGRDVSIPVTFSSSFHYWSSYNDCPGLGRSSSKWKQGSVIGGSGLDFTLGNGEGDASTAGTLTVQKTLSGLALSEGESKTFFFDVYTADGKLYDTLSTAVSADSPYATASISDVPYGQYYVVERDASTDGYTVTTSYLVNGASSSDRSATVELSKDASAQTVQVLNTYEKLPDPTGSVLISKTVSGLDMAKTFRFAIYTAQGELVKNAGISIEKGQTSGSVTVTELPYGEYYITETNAGVEGYTVDATFQVAGGAPTAGRSNVFTVGKDTQNISISVLNAYEEDVVVTAPSEPEPTDPPATSEPSESTEPSDPSESSTPSEPEGTDPTDPTDPDPTDPEETEPTEPSVPLDPTGTLTIRKTATGLANGLVRAYTFHVYGADGSFYKSAVITGSGVANLYGVPYGSYYVVEQDGSVEAYELETTYRVGLNAMTSSRSEVFTVGENSEEIIVQVLNSYTPEETEPTDPSEPEGTEPSDPTEPSESETTEPSDPSEPSESETTEPSDPSEPSESETTEPSDPSEPSVSETTEPSDPSEPSESETTEPSDPSEPSESETTEPSQPSEPSEPVNTEPSQPSDPSEPVSTEPSAPLDPTDPPETEIPEPTLPGGPVHPTDPNHPGEPDHPSDPAHPDDPAPPSEPEETAPSEPAPTEPTPDVPPPSYANVPYTGSTIGLWVTLSILSGSGAVILSLPRKKEEE